MARLHPNGLHEPSALQYLIAEGLLTDEPDQSQYVWFHQISLDEQGNATQEEILTLEKCVVWSRNKTVKRIFNLDVENEVILHAFATSFPVSSVTSQSADVQSSHHSKETALVVVLKTQAHIFCLSGGIHVIPLPFVTARAFAFSEGCIFQPQIPQGSLRSQESTFSSIFRMHENSKEHDSATGPAVFLPAPISPRLPTYCLTDLLADIGVVATSPSRKLQSDTNTLLPANEEILYVSTDSHVRNLRLDSDPRVCLAVSLDRKKSTFTIWSVQRNFMLSDSADGHTDKPNFRRRQSKGIHDRSRIPSGRGPTEASRESLGGLIQSFAEQPIHTQEPALSNIENLAAELHDEFDSGGVQTRSSRRISSMLARSDLAPPTERSAFNDSVRGVISRKSLSRSLRREGSFGSVTERTSFGGRRSFPATTSIFSNTTSFFENGDRISLGEAAGPAAYDSHDLEISNNRLKKDVVFCKLKSFSCHESSTTSRVSAPKVIVIVHPHSFNSESTLHRQLSICVQENLAKIMTVVTIAVKVTTPSPQNIASKSKGIELKAVQVQKGTNIADACLVSQGHYDRLMVLSKTSQDDDVLHLEAPWSPSFRLDMPPKFPMRIFSASVPSDVKPQPHTQSLSRILDDREIKISHFLTSFNLDTVVFCDTRGRQHNVRVEMSPRSKLGIRILQICRFILPTHHQESLAVAFWEIRRWLDTQEVQGNLEDIATAIMLFLMAVPVISNFQEKPLAPNRRKKVVNLRSSSGSLIDATDWSTMQMDEVSGGSPAWMRSNCWKWLGASLDPVVMPKSPSKHSRISPLDQSDGFANQSFLGQCIDLTRDFWQTPAGETMSDTEGYLPTAINQDRNTRRTALASILVAVFLLLQEQKLQICSDASTVNDNTTLIILIAQLSSWLGWSQWRSSMLMEYDSRISAKTSLQLESSRIDKMDVPPEPFAPTSVFEYVCKSVLSTGPKFHALVDLLQSSDQLAIDDPLLLRSTELLPRSSAVMNCLSGKTSHTDLSARHQLSEILVIACESKLRKVFSKDDTNIGTAIRPSSSPSRRTETRKQHHQSMPRQISHIAVRDNRVLGHQALDAENLSRWDVSSEVDRLAVTRLIFHQDRRFQEASKLVNQTRAPEIEFEVQSNWTEVMALEAQKQLTQFATRRTFAVATGRGMMHFNSRTPLLTEIVPVPKFSLQCIMRSKNEANNGQPMTFSADRANFTEEKVYWAFFHNGASAGLMISKETEFIDTSWILYNKPPELTNRHAGLLLALGLNGHLKSLAKWVAFKYLTPKHTMTSVGLLLGLAASYKGTADTLITRLLSVHVTCLLPPGAAELNLSPLTQMTGIMGIGLVYHDTQHRRMSEVMLSEIECQDFEERLGDEPILRDEGYRLIAGMSLGLINLGHGSHLHSLHDTRLVERLLAIAVGTKNINLVHVLDRATAGAVLALAFVFMKTNDNSIARKVDIPDTSHQFDYVRPDVFLLRTLARHLIMWDKLSPTQSFVRDSLPIQYRHRVDLNNVKHLVTNDLPLFHIIAGICFAISLRYSGSQDESARDLLVSYLDQFLRLSRLPALTYDTKVTLNGVRNCLDILALSCATVMAGSGDITVFRRLRALHGRTDKDTPYGSHLAAHMAIGALFLSGGTATFGTSNLAVASLVISFYPLFPHEILDNRGHLQALRHLWVLAVEHRCVSVRDSETGQVIGNIDVTLTSKDGTQRTLRTPCLLPELDSIDSIYATTDEYWPVDIDLNERSKTSKMSPNSKSKETGMVRDDFKNSSIGIQITLRRRPIYEKPNMDPFDTELQALETSKGVPSGGSGVTTQHRTEFTIDHKMPLDWVFSLASFEALDHAERALVLSGLGQSGAGSGSSDTDAYAKTLLHTTPVDSQLELNMGTLGPEAGSVIPRAMHKQMNGDKLWLIRILLSLADRAESGEDNEGKNQGQQAGDEATGDEIGKQGDSGGLRKEFIERLRWRVWEMSNGNEVDDDNEVDESDAEDVDVV